MTDAPALAPIRPAVARSPGVLGAGVALGVLTLAAAPFAGYWLADLPLKGGPTATVVAASTEPSATQVAPFYLQAANGAERERAVRCLTDAVYYEAAREPVDGQRAIAQVVVNRVRDQHFPKSICGVVYEGWERKTGCQFSFVCDGSIRRRHADPLAWNRLRPIAEQALSGYVQAAVGTATHYHADYVRPGWLKSVAETGEIGRHTFYSWKNKAGLPRALRFAYEGGEMKVPEAVLDGGARPAGSRRAALRGFA